MKQIPKKLGRGIYRGIYKEIAIEEGCTPENVSQAVWRRNNPRMIQLVLNKMAERKKIMTEFQKALVD